MSSGALRPNLSSATHGLCNCGQAHLLLWASASSLINEEIQLVDCFKSCETVSHMLTESLMLAQFCAVLESIAPEGRGHVNKGPLCLFS